MDEDTEALRKVLAHVLQVRVGGGATSWQAAIGDAGGAAADAVLASDWLAAHDARVRAEALAPIEALAEEWGDEDELISHVAACQDFACKDCVVAACAADLRAAMEAKG